MNTTPLVSIVCTTYNHELYIEQTLDSFVLQQCSFPIEIIVHDDASTDGTAEIIRKYANTYPNLIRPILQTENQYSQGVDIWEYLFTKEAKGKYIAICEGDDFWTDPQKLQKQIDFLENNSDCGLVYSKAMCYIQKTGKFKGTVGGEYYSFENLLINNAVPTLTVVLRKDLSVQYFQEVRPSEQCWLLGDWPMWLWFARNSNLHYLDIVTATYRILQESASKTSDPKKKADYIRSYVSVQEYFVKHYNIVDTKLTQEIYFHKIWELFCLACLFNVDSLFNEVKESIHTIQTKKSRVFYMKAVLYFKRLRYLLVGYKKYLT